METPNNTEAKSHTLPKAHSARLAAINLQALALQEPPGNRARCPSRQPPSETSPGAHPVALGEDAEPVLDEGGEGQLFLELELNSSMCPSQESLPAQQLWMISA